VSSNNVYAIDPCDCSIRRHISIVYISKKKLFRLLEHGKLFCSHIKQLLIEYYLFLNFSMNTYGLF